MLLAMEAEGREAQPSVPQPHHTAMVERVHVGGTKGEKNKVWDEVFRGTFSLGVLSSELSQNS